MIVQGLFLMFIGMGVVFLFLIILVITVISASAFLRRYFPETEEIHSSAHPAPAVSRDAEIAAVIAAARAFARS